MKYEEFSISQFFNSFKTEAEAIELVWRYKSEDQGHTCPKCHRKKYYQHIERPEIRECQHCGHQHRLRVGTIFEDSKLSMLTWIRAIYLMMTSKRGISALELQRQLKIGSYQTALLLLRKVRVALMERDSKYKLEGIIELDGAKFGRRATNNQESVLIAVESKKWIDEKGHEKKKAGFAKVFFGKETKDSLQNFVDQDIRMQTEVHSDAARPYLDGLKNVDVKSVGMYNDPERLEKWLPWVFRFTCNAKAWLVGTHHGVNSKYFKLYLAEYIYRFNRRHDVKKYFSRALFSCVQPLMIVNDPPPLQMAA